MTIKASCHCGATQFEVSEAPASVTECNCTFCSKRGGLWAYYSAEQVILIKNDRPTVYTRDESTHEHHHCGVCGCGAYNEVRCTWDEKRARFHPAADCRQREAVRRFRSRDSAGQAP